MTKRIQSLGVAGRLFPQIVSGDKTSTIRWRELRIVPGLMRYECDDTCQTVIVTVRRCTDMPLKDVARYLGKTEDWPDPIMLAGMRDHYPDIQMEDLVQVIEHGTPV